MYEIISLFRSQILGEVGAPTDHPVLYFLGAKEVKKSFSIEVRLEGGISQLRESCFIIRDKYKLDPRQ
jgi:hypothetical protein